MKALTIWQPWASLIMAGAKPVEWRGWPCPKYLRGQRVAIHAGARPAKAAEIEDILARVRDKETSLICEIAEPMLRQTHRLSWPLSSVLGTAVMGNPISVDDWLKTHAPEYLDSDRIDHSKWAWPLTDIVRFEPFIPCRGAQGFWNWSPPNG